MPISVITELPLASTCSTWLVSASSPVAAVTAVSASTIGRNAATSVPKATMRMASVSGNDSASAVV